MSTVVPLLPGVGLAPSGPVGRQFRGLGSGEGDPSLLPGAAPGSASEPCGSARRAAGSAGACGACPKQWLDQKNYYGLHTPLAGEAEKWVINHNHTTRSNLLVVATQLLCTTLQHRVGARTSCLEKGRLYLVRGFLAAQHSTA